jgi:hypothetical protein
MMILIMHFSPTFRHFMSLRSKYSSQRPVREDGNTGRKDEHMKKEGTKGIRVIKNWTEIFSSLTHLIAAYVTTVQGYTPSNDKLIGTP